MLTPVKAGKQGESSIRPRDSDRFSSIRPSGSDSYQPILGSKGALRADNVALSTVAFAGADGIISDKLLPFFLERYAEAYRLELDHFIDALTRGTPPLPGGSDGVKALALADAALQSLQTRRAIAL